MQERKSQRYKGFYYGSGYSYFVTICIRKDRDPAIKRIVPFGDITQGKMELSDAGKVIEKQWNWISERFPYADAGPFVVMPDHFHGILTIHDNRNEINYGGTMKREKIKPLSELIGAFKTTTSKMIHEMGETSFNWQRSYYDRIIRNQAEYLRIETYIHDNPIRSHVGTGRDLSLRGHRKNKLNSGETTMKQQYFAGNSERKRLYQFLIFSIAFLIPLSVIAFPHSDNGNGTVTDQKTGLIWQKCSMGQTNDATCSGAAATTTWVNAVASCENLSLAGRTDWRLPNVNELKSIVKETAFNPSIDSSVFPATVAGYYWSSTANAGYPADAWLVNFYDGYSGNDYARTNNVQVRCLAGP